jgi:hypothetical protein
MIKPGNRRWKNRAVHIGAVAGLLAGAFPIYAQDTRTEFWPVVDVYQKLNERSRLFFLYSATKLDNRQTYADGSFGFHFDYYAGRTLRPRIMFRDATKNQLVLFRSGYQFTRTPGDAGHSVSEHTAIIEGHARVPLPLRIFASNRNRVDLRFVNGTFTPRYRNRLKVERTFKLRRFELTPYVHAEAFYDWRWNKFNRVRYSGGMEWAITSFLVLEGYSLMQRDTKSSPEYVYATGVALQFYLKRGR